jgi:hypothetical protein
MAVASPGMDAVFEGPDDGSGDAMPGKLASIRVLASAVDQDPEDMLYPAGADLGVEHAFGLPSLDEVDDGIVGRYHRVWRSITLEYARIDPRKRPLSPQAAASVLRRHAGLVDTDLRPSPHRNDLVLPPRTSTVPGPPGPLRSPLRARLPRARRLDQRPRQRHERPARTAHLTMPQPAHGEALLVATAGADLRDSVLPGEDDLDTGRGEVPDVAGHDLQAVHPRRGRDQGVGVIDGRSSVLGAGQ